MSYADNAEGELSAEGEWIDPAELEALGALIGIEGTSDPAAETDGAVSDPLASSLP
jgi:hypothetical protein